MAKIMLLTPFWSGVGGAETFAHELHRQVIRKHSVWLCTTKWNKTWKGICWADSFLVIVYLLSTAFSFCRRHRIDTIHALGFSAGFVGVIMKKLFKVKLIVTPLALYNFDSKLLRYAVKYVLKHADTILVESYVSRANFINLCDANKIKIFTHWVDTSIFYPVRTDNKRLNVLFVGRDLKEKGSHIIECVEKLLKGVKFTYVKDAPFESLPKYYQMADVLVVPSLYAESPNRVVAEAASCGCVVVVSKRGALAEQVNGFGIAIEPTITKFKEVLYLLSIDREWVKKLRVATIKYASENLTEANAEVITKEY